MNSNFALTLVYLNPALNNLAQSIFYRREKTIFFSCLFVDDCVRNQIELN